MKTSRIHTLFSLLFITLLLNGCYSSGVLVIPAETHSHSTTHTTTVITHYAPPHAPAHGHRHHYHNHDLRYDSGFGAYVVINMPGLYFYNDHYMRFHDGGWQITTHLNNRWRPARDNDIPRKLKKGKHHNKKHRRRDEHRDNHLSEHRSEDQSEHRDAPRHGHRRQHHDHQLSFNSGIGAYILLKQPDIYFYNNRYMRHHRGKWQTTNKLNGRWYAAKSKEIPRKLKSSKQAKNDKHQKKEKNKGRYKGR